MRVATAGAAPGRCYHGNFDDGAGVTYLLLTITPADREKILADCAGQPGQLRWFKDAMTSGTFPDTWARDAGRDHYLLRMPGQIREEWDRQPYCAFIEGRMFRLAQAGFFSRDMYFNEDDLPADLEPVKDEIRAAFAVHGEGGRGPLDEYGGPEVYTPRFVARKPLDAM